MPAPKRMFVYDKQTKRIVQVAGPERTHSPTGRKLPNIKTVYGRKGVESLALSVHPDQAEDMRARVKEAGADHGCTVAPDGTVRFSSEKCRDRVMRHCGFVDRDSYKR